MIFLLYQFVYEGWGLAVNAWPQRPTSIPISFFWIYLSVPLGSAIMILILAQFWLRAFVGIFDPERGGLPDYEPALMRQASEIKLSSE